MRPLRRRIRIQPRRARLLLPSLNVWLQLDLRRALQVPDLEDVDDREDGLDEVLLDEVLLDEVLLDEVLLDEVLLDEVLLDEVLPEEDLEHAFVQVLMVGYMPALAISATQDLLAQ